MSDQECTDEGQPAAFEHWMSGDVLLDSSDKPNMGMACASIVPLDVLSLSNTSEHLLVASDSPGYGDGSMDSSSTDTDDEPLAKIAKMRKVPASSPCAKSPKKQRKATGPRAPTAYSLFVRENQPAVKSEHSSARPAEILRILRGMWNGMDTKARKPYNDASKIAKAEHKAKFAAMQHEHRDNDSDANKQGAVPENDALVTAALGPLLSAPMVLPSADTPTDKPALAKPSAGRQGSAATTAPRITSAALPSAGFVEPDATAAGIPIRNADSPYPVSRVLSLLKASPTAAAVVAGSFSSPAGAVAVLPEARPGGSTVVASSGKVEGCAFAASSASSARPQQAYAALTAQAAQLPADAAQPSRSVLHSAAAGQLGAVMTNGRTKIFIVAQQNNGVSSTAPHTIRLVTVGPQATQQQRPKVDQCYTAEPKNAPSVSTFLQPEPALHAATVGQRSGGLSAPPPPVRDAPASDGASSGRRVVAGSSPSVGGASESLASNRGGRHLLTAAAAPRASPNASIANEDGPSEAHSDFDMAADPRGERGEQDVEMAEITGSVDAVYSRARTLLQTCHGCGRSKRSPICEDGDNLEPLREQSKKLLQWSHEHYCRSQCAIDHCRNVFDSWVATRRLALKK